MKKHKFYLMISQKIRNEKNKGVVIYAFYSIQILYFFCLFKKCKCKEVTCHFSEKNA